MKNLKRSLSLLLALVMALSCMSLPAFATGEGLTVELNGEECSYVLENGVLTVGNQQMTLVKAGFYQSATKYDTSTDFYITNIDGLKYFRDFVDGLSREYENDGNEGLETTAVDFHSTKPFAGKTVHLLADIDLAGENWLPIGTTAKLGDAAYYTGDKFTFEGNFDGNGHTIYNLNSKNSEGYKNSGNNPYRDWGFFGYVNPNSKTNHVFKDLTIQGVDISTNSAYLGALIGNAATAAPITIQSCHVTGKINLKGYNFVGGLVGIGEVNVLNSSVIAETDKSVIDGSTTAGLVASQRTSHTEDGTSVDDNTVKKLALIGTTVGALVGSAAGGATGKLTIQDNLIDTCTLNGELAAEETLIAANADSGITVTLSNNTVKPNSVAEVNGQVYDSVAEAITNADGKVITLLNKKALTQLATLVNDGNSMSGVKFQLVEGTTYDLSGYTNWTPIGTGTLSSYALTTGSHPFRGTFDGNGATISGLTITGSNDYVGLFGVVSGATIQNVKLSGANVSGKAYVGGVVGAVEGKSGATTAITDCDVANSKITGTHFVGGVTGYLVTGPITVSDCDVSGSTIEAQFDASANDGKGDDGDDVGGIVGLAYNHGGNITITGSTVSTSTIKGVRQAGGIAGMLNGGPAVTDCTVTDVEVQCTGTAYIANKMAFGGVVGVFCNSGSTASNNAVSGLRLTVADNAVASVKENARMGYISGGSYKTDTFVVNNASGEGNTVANSSKMAGTAAYSDTTIPNVIDGGATDVAEIYAADGTTLVAKATSLTTARNMVRDSYNGGTIKLLSNVENAPFLLITKNTKVDLNGHKIDASSSFMIVDGATLTIDGTTEGSQVEGRIFVGYSSNYTSTGNGNLVINGGKYTDSDDFVISTNGMLDDSDVTINGAVIESTNDTGMYLAGGGTYQLTDSKVKGTAGIEAKAGNLTVTNTDVTATAEVTGHVANGNGTSTSGYAIALVENHSYKTPRSATILSGTITGPVGIVDDDADKTNNFYALTIDGTCTAKFSTDVIEYVATGYTTFKVDGYYTIGAGFGGKTANQIQEKLTGNTEVVVLNDTEVTDEEQPEITYVAVKSEESYVPVKVENAAEAAATVATELEGNTGAAAIAEAAKEITVDKSQINLAKVVESIKNDTGNEINLTSATSVDIDVQAKVEVQTLTENTVKIELHPEAVVTTTTTTESGTVTASKKTVAITNDQLKTNAKFKIKVPIPASLAATGMVNLKHESVDFPAEMFYNVPVVNEGGNFFAYIDVKHFSTVEGTQVPRDYTVGITPSKDVVNRLDVEETTDKDEHQFTVDLKLTNNSSSDGFRGVDVTLPFDKDAFTLTAVTLAENFEFTKTSDTENGVTNAANSSGEVVLNLTYNTHTLFNDSIAASGTKFATLTFTVKDNAAVGKHTFAADVTNATSVVAVGEVKEDQHLLKTETKKVTIQGISVFDFGPDITGSGFVDTETNHYTAKPVNVDSADITVAAAWNDEAPAAKTGYQFAGWKVSGTGELIAKDDTTTKILPDKTYTAVFTEIEYTISLNADGGTIDLDAANTGIATAKQYKQALDGTTVIPSQYTKVYTVTDTPFQLPQPTKNGYTFKGWKLVNDEQDTALDPRTIGNEDHTTVGDYSFKAVWEINHYTLTLSNLAMQPEDTAGSEITTLKYTVNGGDEQTATIDNGKVEIPYTVNDTIEVTVNPSRRMYTFGGWANGVATDAVTHLTFNAQHTETGNQTYNAVWTVNSKTITFYYSIAPAGNGAVTKHGMSHVFTVDKSDATMGTGNYYTEVGGSDVTGFKFLGWSADSNATEGTAFAQLTTDKDAYYAVYSPKTYTVTEAAGSAYPFVKTDTTSSKIADATFNAPYRFEIDTDLDAAKYVFTVEVAGKVTLTKTLSGVKDFTLTPADINQVVGDESSNGITLKVTAIAAKDFVVNVTPYSDAGLTLITVTDTNNVTEDGFHFNFDHNTLSTTADKKMFAVDAYTDNGKTVYAYLVVNDSVETAMGGAQNVTLDAVKKYAKGYVKMASGVATHLVVTKDVNNGLENGNVDYADVTASYQSVQGVLGSLARYMGIYLQSDVNGNANTTDGRLDMDDVAQVYNVYKPANSGN